MKTPFEAAGYTKDTKFKVLKDFYTVKKGDVVTLEHDDGSVNPVFKTEDGIAGFAFLPSKSPYNQEYLEVLQEVQI